ncbi:MAG: FHA domain-containing protein [Planctomycetota bacterium]|nr:FHA domain-containing protein [Planctomycetota bacterium]
MAIQLQILNGKRQGLVVDLNQAGDMFVGQRDSAQIRIDDPWISWDHSRIFHRNNEIWVEDLASTNGTYVNCQRVKCERLNNEDILFFGKTHALFLQTSDVGPLDYQRGLDMAADNDNVWSDRRGPGAGTALGMPTGLDMPPMDPAPGMPANGFQDPLFNNSTNLTDSLARRGRDPFASGEDFNLLESNDSDEFGLFGNSNENPRNTGFSAPLQGGDDPYGLSNTAPMLRPFSDGPAPGIMSSRSASMGLPPGSQVGPLPSNTDVNDIEKLLSTSSLDDLDDLIPHDHQNPPPPPPLPNPPATMLAPPPMASGQFAPPPSGIMNSGVLGSGINALPPLPPPSGRFTPPNITSAPPPLNQPLPPLSGMQSGVTPPLGPLPPLQSIPPLQSMPPIQSAPAPQQTATETIKSMSRDDLIARLTLMQGEMGKLKGAFQAAQAGGQQAVVQAASIFKDKELDRLNRLLAEVRAELARARDELENVCEELDNVTDEMIEKEDLIQELQDRISQGGDVFAL